MALFFFVFNKAKSNGNFLSKIFSGYRSSTFRYINIVVIVPQANNFAKRSSVYLLYRIIYKLQNLAWLLMFDV